MGGISEVVNVAQLRELLRKMTDRQLREYGNLLQKLCKAARKQRQGAHSRVCYSTGRGDSRMAKKKESEDHGQYKVGDQIKAKLRDGRTVDATIRLMFCR